MNEPGEGSPLHSEWATASAADRPVAGTSQRSHWHRAESLSWVRGCGRVADLKIVDEKSSSDSKRLFVGEKQKVDTPLGPESPRKNQGTTLRPTGLREHRSA